MRKEKRTVAIDQDLLIWVDQKIRDREFASLSHAIQKALMKLQREYSEPQIEIENLENKQKKREGEVKA